MWLIDLLDLEFIDNKLRTMMNDIRAEFGMLTITSLYRIGDQGVHGTLPLRAVDVRCHNQEMGKVIETWTNKHYIYDRKRPGMKVCLFHDVGRGWHLHFQVHSNTKKKC